MTDDVGLRIIIEDDSKPTKAPQASPVSSSDVGFTIPTAVTSKHVTDTFTQSRTWTEPPEPRPAPASPDPITGKILESFSSPKDHLVGDQKGTVVTSGKSPVDAQRIEYENRLKREQEEREKSRSWYDKLWQGTRDLVSRRFGVNPQLAREAGNLLSEAKGKKPDEKVVQPEYDAGTGAWMKDGKAVPPPEWSTGVSEANAAGATEVAGEAAGVGAAAGVGMAFAGIVIAAGLATVAVKKMADAFHEKTRELSYYSPEIAAAGGRQSVREVRSDMLEAQTLGTDYANLVDEFGELKSLLRELLLPVKRFVITSLSVFIETAMSFIELFKPFLELIGGALNIISGILQYIADGIKAIGDTVQEFWDWWMGRENTEPMDLMDQFFANIAGVQFHNRKNETAGSGDLNIPAFGGL